MQVPTEISSELAQPPRCGLSAALAFWQRHAGRHLTQDLAHEIGRCGACGLEEADLIRQPGRPPTCAARYSLTRTYPKPDNASRKRRWVGPTLAVVTPGKAVIVAEGIQLPGVGPELSQVTDRSVDAFLADIIIRPPKPPSLVVTFGKDPEIYKWLRLNIGSRLLFVSGARPLDIDLRRLRSAETAVAGVELRDLVRAMSIDHDRRRGALITPERFAILEDFVARTPAADPSRLPDKGTDTAAALLMILQRLEATNTHDRGPSTDEEELDEPDSP
jgi:hypothetical protein